jgi:hemerythrin-like domain-containing protein
MKLTDRLKVEHGVFLLQLRHVEELMASGAGPEMLASSLETILGAEAHHSAVEDRLLYPALEQRLGAGHRQLSAAQEDHRRLEGLVAAVRAQQAAPAAVTELVQALREHMEREIHGVFVLAEEALSAVELESMCNWNAEHIYEETGNAALWLERLGKPGGARSGEPG